VAGLSPQLKEKLRKEIIEDAKQELAEMDEVKTWNIKFDRTHKDWECGR
jgi:hypothetical protein